MNIQLLQLPQAVRWIGRATSATVQYGLHLTHRVIFLVGLSVILIALVFWLSPSWRSTFTDQLRVFFGATAPPDFRRLLAANSEPKFKHNALHLQKQDRLADYLARRYRVARVPIGNLVRETFVIGQQLDLDPLLLLAVMAIESRFNPYAESVVGAQGLMQIMPKFHLRKFDYFGGPEATLDPLANLRVGALILKEYITQGRSLTEGLRRYVGALSSNNSHYAEKVLTERQRLHNVMRGLNVSIYAERTTRLLAANLSSTPFTYLYPSAPPKVLLSSTASLITTR